MLCAETDDKFKDRLLVRFDYRRAKAMQDFRLSLYRANVAVQDLHDTYHEVLMY